MQTCVAVPASRQYEDEVEPARPRRAVRIAALVPPGLILLGLLAHTVLEGLAIGLQVGAQYYADQLEGLMTPPSACPDCVPCMLASADGRTGSPCQGLTAR
jgi:hypothetical protein